ncbi:MAG: acetyl-CoA sensor PanZ family protein [Pseudomonas sp.]
MPVFVEVVSAPSAQDKNDLAKIYADAPAWLLPPYPDVESLLDSAIEQGTLIAGRFNDRLLGAALLERGESHWRLSHLCVRQLTRQRGVARRLLDETQRWATAAGKPLQLAAPQDRLDK